MSFLITTVMENTSHDTRLIAQHGLSLLIEGEGRKFVYDTGQSPRFLLNAKALGVDLSGADALILSHGHWDHTGGAAALITSMTPPGALYVGEGFFTPRYRTVEDGELEIGSLLSERTVSLSGVPCFTVGREPAQLSANAWLLSGFASTDAHEAANPVMMRDADGAHVTDTFPEEVALVLKGGEGLTVISGCSHNGIISICTRIQDVFGEPVRRFVGGTHLISADDERIAYTCSRLQEMGIRHLGACHCTGEKAESFFASRFPGFYRNNVGTRTEIP
jgi:7,8-dihydropterin-6-yl-methyl-4-(beta-D-ribofuranosyl)aminobenzene 5'-phosphate synthase